MRVLAIWKIRPVLKECSKKMRKKYKKNANWPKMTFQGPIWVPKVSFWGFWGWFWSIKVLSEFWFGHPKCHFWHPQNDKKGEWKEKWFLAIFLFCPFSHWNSHCSRKKTTTMGRKGPRAKTKIVLKSVKQWEQLGNMHNRKFRNFWK